MFFLNEMNSKIKLASTLIVVLYLVVASSKRVKIRHGPTGMSHEDSTNCSDFAKFGRFNPYSVLHTKWFVFYYWAPVRSITTYVFTVPTANYTRRLKQLLDGKCVLPVQWNARLLLMEDQNRLISLLVERSDRGEYWLYPVARVKKHQKITPIDVRMKQTGDNRLVGILDCVADTLLVMSRLNDVPPKGRLHEEASRLGYRGRKGKSYLYQGHEWGPVGEADESIFWDQRHKTIEKDTSKEDKGSEGSSEDAEETTKKPGQTPKPKKGTVVAPVKPEDDETCTKVMPVLWNDPEPNPNPDNLVTVDDLKELDNNIEINDNLATEGPDGSIDNKQESNADKQSETNPENDKLQNHNDAHNMEKTDSTDNRQEKNINEESEIPPKNDNPHNHKVCPETADPDDDDESCVVCYKSQVSYPLPDDSYIPDSASSMPDLKDNENGPPDKVEVPRFVVAGTELPLEVQSRTEVPIPKAPSVETPRAEIPTPKVLLTKTPQAEVPTPKVLLTKTPQAEVPTPKVLLTKTPQAEVPTPKVLLTKTPQAEVPTPKVLLTKTPQAEVPTPKVLLTKTPQAEVPTPKVLLTKTPHAKVPTPKVLLTKTPHAKVPTPKVLLTKTPPAKVPGVKVKARSPAPQPQDQTNSSEIIYLYPKDITG